MIHKHTRFILNFALYYACFLLSFVTFYDHILNINTVSVFEKITFNFENFLEYLEIQMMSTEKGL